MSIEDVERIMDETKESVEYQNVNIHYPLFDIRLCFLFFLYYERDV